MSLGRHPLIDGMEVLDLSQGRRDEAVDVLGQVPVVLCVGVGLPESNDHDKSKPGQPLHETIRLRKETARKGGGKEGNERSSPKAKQYNPQTSPS